MVIGNRKKVGRFSKSYRICHFLPFVWASETQNVLLVQTFLVKVAWKKGIDIVASNNLNEVIDAYMHALTAKYPKHRYVCGWDAKLLLVPLSFLPSVAQVIYSYAIGVSRSP